MLAAFGVPLAGFTYCPHHPEGSVEGLAMACDCRKPAPGMIVRMAAEHGIDLARSWMIGDILDDVQAGRGAGCRTILIDSGNETKWVLSPEREPHYRAPDLADAARHILEQDDTEASGRTGPGRVMLSGLGWRGLPRTLLGLPDSQRSDRGLAARPV